MDDCAEEAKIDINFGVNPSSEERLGTPLLSFQVLTTLTGAMHAAICMRKKNLSLTGYAACGI